MVQKLNKLFAKVLLGVFIFSCVNFIVDDKAEAIVDLRAGYGFGNLNRDGSKVASQNGLNFQVMFQPLIVLPVGVGASYLYYWVDYSNDNTKDRNYEKASIDLEAWIPFIPLFTPYAGLSFIPWNEFSAKNDKVDDLKIGYSLRAGIKVDVVPLLNAFLEGQYSKFKSNDYDYSSLVGVLGLEVDL